jgi:long-chain acyl-CoA synthetase
LTVDAHGSTNHCPLSIIFSAENHITDLLKIAHKCPSLRIIVSMDPLPTAEKAVLKSWAEHAGLELLDMGELEKWGSESGVALPSGPVEGAGPEEERLMSERVVTISYTSGTTGKSACVCAFPLWC